MAEYDPTASVNYDATEDQDDDSETHDQPHENGVEDDDYDPSSFNFPDGGDRSQTAQPSKPRTIGGFVVDSDDEEEQEARRSAPPEQAKEEVGARSGADTTAVAETHDVNSLSLHSEPQEDSAAIPSVPQTAQSAHVAGSTPDVSAVSDVSPAAPLSTTASLSASNPIAQEHGKAASAPQSATPTPQPLDSKDRPVMQAAVPTPTLSSTQRLPHDKVGHLEDRIKEDPKAETDAWKSLISHYREKDQLDNARKVYWRFFEVFPSATKMWHEFAQMELEHEQMKRVEEIFSACLTQYPSVDMWNLYLDYLRRVHPLISDTDGSKRGIIASAFEVVLDHVGIDPDSGKLWHEYLDFIKTGPGTPGGTSWQDQQKMDLLRKAYQRAVRLPHSEYAKMWKEYDHFELTMNKATARQNLMTQSPHYMTARGARLQLEQKMDGLDRSALSVLPPLRGCAGEEHFLALVGKYKDWISWEKEDPLVLKDEDMAEYRKRVLYVYKQATMQLRFLPEIWFDAATWCFEQGVDDMTRQGEEFLDNGVSACPESVLLALSKADRIESSLEPGSNDEVAIRNGEKLDVPYENVHAALYTLMKKMQERLKKAVDDVKQHFASLAPDEEQEQQDIDDEDGEDGETEKPKSREEQEQSQLEQVRQIHAERMDTTKRTISYMWVAKMRAFRRIQGQGAPGRPRKGFRGVFGEARPRGQLSSDVYIASALMEWHCYKDPSASKIFERGLKLFPMDEGFALEYVKFLIANNDDVNARAVFETTLTKIMQAPTLTESKKREKCAGLLRYMHEYESAYGDLAHIQRMEKKMKELSPEQSDLIRFSHRFDLPNFDAVHAQLVISPTQAVPKPAFADDSSHQPVPTIEQHRPASPSDASHIRLGPNGPYVASPKRPLDDSDNESPQRSKFLRGESPLKGAAGRRLQNLAASTAGTAAPVSGGTGFMTKSYVPGAVTAAVAPLPDRIHWLLSMIPRADQYRSIAFDASRMVQLMRSIDVDAARARVGY